MNTPRSIIEEAAKKKPLRGRRGSRLFGYCRGGLCLPGRPPVADSPVEFIHCRNDKQGDDASRDETAYGYKRYGLPECASLPCSQGQGNHGNDRRGDGHEEHPEADGACLPDCLGGRHVFIPPENLRIVDDYDGVVHHQSHQHDETDEGEHGDGNPREEHGRNDSKGGQGNRENDHESEEPRFKDGRDDDECEPDGDEERLAEFPEGLLHEFGVSPVVDGVSLGKVEVRYGPAGVGRGFADADVTGVRFDGDRLLPVFPDDLGGTVPPLHLGELLQRHETVACHDRQVLDLEDILCLVRADPGLDIVLEAVLAELPGVHADKIAVNHVGQGGHVDAELGEPPPHRQNLQFRFAHFYVDACVHDARHVADAVPYGLRDPVEGFELLSPDHELDGLSASHVLPEPADRTVNAGHGVHEGTDAVRHLHGGGPAGILFKVGFDGRLVGSLIPSRGAHGGDDIFQRGKGLPDVILDFLRPVPGHEHRGVARQGDADGHDAAVGAGHHFGSDKPSQPEGPEGEPQEKKYGDERMGKSPPEKEEEQHLEAGVNPVPPPAENAPEPRNPLVGLEPRGHGRREGQGDPQGEKSGVHDGHGVLHQELARDPAHDGHRQEYTEVRCRSRDDRQGDLHRSLFRRLLGGVPHVPKAVDVLDDEDGVVHQNAHGDGKPQGAHDVQRVAVHGQGHEGGEKRHRHGHRDDECGREPLEEEVEHHHGEQDADPHVPEYVLHRRLDELRVVEGYLSREVGHGLQNLVEFLLHELPCPHDVGIGAGADPELHHRVSVDPGDGADFLLAVHHRSQVPYPHRVARCRGDHDVLQFFDPVELADKAEPRLVLLLGDVTRRIGDVVCRHHRRKGLDAHPVFIQGHGVQQYPNLPVPAPRHAGLADPVHPGETGNDVVLDNLLRFLLGKGACEGDNKKGLGVDVHLPEDGLVHAVGKLVPGRFHLVRHVHEGLVDVYVHLHLEDHEGVALRRIARDLVKSFEVRDGILDGFRHQLLDLVGAGAGIPRLDNDHGNIHLGKQGNGKLVVAAHPEEDENKHHRPGEHRALYAETYKTAHGYLPAVPAAASPVRATRAFSKRRLCPLTTTRSPSESPFSMETEPFCPSPGTISLSFALSLSTT
ncbi:hypothetical protein SDC9_57035 [bioreactor metagenome]|uniref:Uncharacterized protein n=1 Tax=bioreactor metagenome TaxID=1076179 RepID=A0A644X4C8_9ZZZZ